VLGALSKNLRQMLYERLADSGVVRAERSRILGVVPVHRWPAQDASHEAEVRRLVTQALVHQVAPDTRIAALIALLRARVRGQDRRPPGSTACPSGNSGHGRRRSPRATGHHRPSARRSRRRWPRSSPPPPQPPSPPPRPLARPAAVGRAHDRTDHSVQRNTHGRGDKPGLVTDRRFTHVTQLIRSPRSATGGRRHCAAPGTWSTGPQVLADGPADHVRDATCSSAARISRARLSSGSSRTDSILAAADPRGGRPGIRL
jgi:hypothetical protein